MFGDESPKEISEKSLSDKLTCEWICGKYSFCKSLHALYNSRRIIILLTSMQCLHRGYVAEFCTLAQCSRSANKNGDDFDVFLWFLPYLDLNQYWRVTNLVYSHNIFSCIRPLKSQNTLERERPKTYSRLVSITWSLYCILHSISILYSHIFGLLHTRLAS